VADGNYAILHSPWTSGPDAAATLVLLLM